MSTRRSFLKSAAGACVVPALPALSAAAVPFQGWRYNMSYMQQVAAFEVDGREGLVWVSCPELWFDSYYWREDAPAHERGTRVYHLKAWDLSNLSAARLLQLKQHVREGLKACGADGTSAVLDEFWAMFNRAGRGSTAVDAEVPKLRSYWSTAAQQYIIELVSAPTGWKLYSSGQMLNGYNP